MIENIFDRIGITNNDYKKELRPMFEHELKKLSQQQKSPEDTTGVPDQEISLKLKRTAIKLSGLYLEEIECEGHESILQVLYEDINQITRLYCEYVLEYLKKIGLDVKKYGQEFFNKIYFFLKAQVLKNAVVMSEKAPLKILEKNFEKKSVPVFEEFWSFFFGVPLVFLGTGIVVLAKTFGVSATIFGIISIGTGFILIAAGFVLIGFGVLELCKPTHK